MIIKNPIYILGKRDNSVLVEKTVTENGIYRASEEGANGFAIVNVNVGSIAPVIRLSPPTIRLIGNRLYIRNSIANGMFASGFKIYVNGACVALASAQEAPLVDEDGIVLLDKDGLPIIAGEPFSEEVILELELVEGDVVSARSCGDGFLESADSNFITIVALQNALYDCDGIALCDKDGCALLFAE